MARNGALHLPMTESVHKMATQRTRSRKMSFVGQSLSTAIQKVERLMRTKRERGNSRAMEALPNVNL